jgi:peptide deformylase
MIEMNFVSENDPILSEPCQEFDFENPPVNAEEFANSLYNKMVQFDGLGLSANQVGYPYRVFAMRNDENPMVLFNPKIVFESENEVIMKEGCLSFPLLYLSVKRPDSVRVRYQNWDGTVDTLTLIGMSARIALHEYDHLEGKTFTQKASQFESQRAMRKRMILQRKVKKLAKK